MLALFGNKCINAYMDACILDLVVIKHPTFEFVTYEFLENMSFSGEIPIVDLNLNGSISTCEPEILRNITEDLDNGLMSHGCVYLTNHGVPAEIVSHLISMHFFNFMLTNFDPLVRMV